MGIDTVLFPGMVIPFIAFGISNGSLKVETSDRKDPKGYYAILQVAPNASVAVIKAVYRHRAMELHPDRNKSSTATADFQRLQLAFSVLNDSKKRAAYDTQAAIGNSPGAGKTGRSGASSSHEPIACSVCVKITAQPRYVIVWEIHSFIVVTHRLPIAGIFCPNCAERKALRSTGATWILGWWGFPWGPIYSVHAILNNLVGGERPALPNAKLLAHQAVSFSLRGEHKIAVNIAREGLKFAKKVPESDPDRGALISTLQDMCKATPTKFPVMVNAWRLFRRPFYIQAGILATVAVTLAMWGNVGQRGRGAPNVASVTPAQAKLITNPNFPALRPSFIRPATAPNGAAWPTTASYISGYQRRNLKGLSSITIDNTQCDSDVFVKLVSISGAAETTARRFYIPAFGQFTAKKLTKGSYRIEYEDLSTGRKYRGDPFEAQEIPMPGGVQFSKDSLTLYKVPDGNANMAEIDDTEFDSGDSDDVDSGEQLVRG